MKNTVEQKIEVLALLTEAMKAADPEIAGACLVNRGRTVVVVREDGKKIEADVATDSPLEMIWSVALAVVGERQGNPLGDEED